LGGVFDVGVVGVGFGLLGEFEGGYGEVVFVCGLD